MHTLYAATDCLGYVGLPFILATPTSWPDHFKIGGASPVTFGIRHENLATFVHVCSRKCMLCGVCVCVHDCGEARGFVLEQEFCHT